MALDLQQAMIVEAPADVRLLVEAAPGCGKTHVACARVARLLDQGHEPGSILLLSFTRTAVHELRNRIGSLSRNGVAAARGVEIRTIDSLAWRLAVGAEEARSVSSFDDSIEEALAALQRLASGGETEFAPYLARFSHVLVDEAQDLVGARASLIAEFLNRLSPDAGWTVFLDPAQAIYGWSADSEDGVPQARFSDVVGRLQGTVVRRWLTTPHRTSNIALLGLLASLRASVLQAPSGERLAGARQLLDAVAAPEDMQVTGLAAHLTSLGEQAGRALVLYRRRVDALQTLSYLRDEQLTCRLRLGGLPRVAAPWLGLLANHLIVAGVTPSDVTRDDVEAAWASGLSGRWLARDITAHDAWGILRRIGPARKNSIDLGKVATRLAATVVPDEVFTRDLGPGGATIGTVHGSKGRESSHVIFCLPGDVEADGPDASDEEARVLYVAASRAVHSLDVRRSYSARCGYSDSRAWRSTRAGLQVEVGRDGDVDTLEAMVMEDGHHAGDIQSRIASFDGRLQTVHVSTESEKNWTRRLHLPSGELLGALSQSCCDSLGTIVAGRARKGRKGSPPLRMSYLTWLDVTTVALGPDDARGARLPRPWRDSRMILAPVVAGLGYIKRYW